RAVVTARGARRLKAVVVTEAGAVALVLIRALGACVAAVRAGGDVVRLAGAGAVARVGAVALARTVVAARGPRRLKAVVVTEAGAVALVLIRALGARIAAVGACRDVVRLAGAAAVARVGAVALARTVVAARGPRRLEAVVVTDAGAVALVLIR